MLFVACDNKQKENSNDQTPAAARIPSCGFFFLKPIVLFFIFIITLRWRKRPACDRFCNGYERDARTSVLLPCT